VAGPVIARRGGQKGNHNALKTGRHTAKRRALKKQISDLIKRANVAVAEVENRLPRRKPGPNLASKRPPRAKSGTPLPPSRSTLDTTKVEA
jgi:hypothetical protein